MATHIPLREILAIAARRPHAEALRHKRRGAWVSWSWADLAARAEQVGRSLQERHPRAALIAVSGEYAPNLLAFVLAAAQVGASVVALPTSLTRPALAEWLDGARPDLVFVSLREQVGVWQAALHGAAQTPTLVADFHLPWGRPTDAGVIPAADLLGPPPAAARTPDAGDVVWIEESTDWTDGLSFILHVAAQTGRALAFPESRIAAARDRAEIQPAGFALSAAHCALVQHDLAARLPAGGGPAARLTRAALDAARRGDARGHHRWLLRHLRRPLGLSRLRDLTVVVPPGAPRDAGEDLFAAFGIRSGHAQSPVQTAPAERAGLAFA